MMLSYLMISYGIYRKKLELSLRQKKLFYIILLFILVSAYP